MTFLCMTLACINIEIVYLAICGLYLFNEIINVQLILNFKQPGTASSNTESARLTSGVVTKYKSKPQLASSVLNCHVKRA